jgi:hypothetical protein
MKAVIAALVTRELSLRHRALLWNRSKPRPKNATTAPRRPMPDCCKIALRTFQHHSSKHIGLRLLVSSILSHGERQDKAAEYPSPTMATPPSMVPTFQTVVSKFRSRLSKAELDDFKFCSLKDVQQAITDIQAQQDKRRGMRNLSRILGFLEAMKQFGAVVEVFLNTSDILAFVWGPLKFLLLVRILCLTLFVVIWVKTI